MEEGGVEWEWWGLWGKYGVEWKGEREEKRGVGGGIGMWFREGRGV